MTYLITCIFESWRLLNKVSLFQLIVSQVSTERSSEVTSPETTSNQNSSNSAGESAVNCKQEVLMSLLFPVSDDKMSVWDVFNEFVSEGWFEEFQLLSMREGDYWCDSSCLWFINALICWSADFKHESFRLNVPDLKPFNALRKLNVTWSSRRTNKDQ